MTVAGENKPRAPSPAVDLRALFRKGSEAYSAGRIGEALDAFRGVVAAAPHHAPSWVNLGVVWRQTKRADLAAVALRRALDLEPGNAGAWSNLGNALKDLQRYDEANDAHRRAVSIDDSRAMHWHNYGVSLRESGDAVAAEEAFDRALAIDPDHADAHWDRALAKLVQGRFAQAWDDYEWRWRLKETAKVATPALPAWQGEALAGRTLVLYAEQGFGDTLLALRYLGRMNGLGGRIIVCVQAELRRLLQGLPNVDAVAVRSEPLPPADICMPLMSLLGRFTPDIDSIPPPVSLNVPTDAGQRARRLLQRFRNRFRIGIVWSGSVTFRNNQRRSAALERFLPLAEVPGVQLFSLQKGPRLADFKALAPAPAVLDLGSLLEDFADTAAALAELDLIVMTDSSVAHLAGSLGRPVWNLLDWNSYWIYLSGRDATPWYPSMRLFRQPAPGDWDTPFRQIRQALELRVAEHRSAQRSD